MERRNFIGTIAGAAILSPIAPMVQNNKVLLRTKNIVNGPEKMPSS
jgi:hypothetical protein